MANMYDRQDRIEGITKDIRVVIAGAGGIGFHVAKLLAMSGVTEITVYDPDTLEESNLNRLDIVGGDKMIGKNKALIVKEVVKSLRPNCYIKAYPYPVRPHLMPKEKVDWVIDCTDKHAAQLEIQGIADAIGAKYLKAGYDGERMSLNDRVAEWDTGDTEDGYRITPSWIVPALMIAALAVGKVMKYHDGEMGNHLSDFYNAA